MLPLHPSKLNRWIPVLALPFVWLVAQPMSVYGETPVTLRMKNGQSVSGDLVSVGANAVTYKLEGGSASLSQVYSDIQTIDFPEPDLWIEGQDAFDSGKLAAALTAFSKLTGSAPAVTFYPAPGNYRTRAQRKLVDCYRRQRNAGAIAKTLTEIEWGKLPPEEQKDVPLLKLWSALGGDNMEQAAKVAAEMDAEFPIDDPAFPEFSFIRGKLAAKMGANAEALRHFGACYGLPTPDTLLATDAIQQSITLLAELPEREAELRALTHLYTTLCNPKGLWEGAPEAAKAAMAEELPEIAAMDSTTQVNYEGVIAFKFEPNPNPPPKPKGKKNRVKGPTFEPVNAKFATEDAPEGWAEAETRVGRFEPSSDFASMTRMLKEDPRLKLGPGTVLRLSMDVRLAAKVAVEKGAEGPGPSFRFGILTPAKGGYFASIPAGSAGKLQLGTDAGGDDEVLGGTSGIQMLPVDEEAQAFPGLKPNAATHCELTVRLEEGGAVELKAVVDGIETVSVIDASAESPAHANFINGFFAIKVAFHDTALLFDNVLVEVGR